MQNINTFLLLYRLDISSGESRVPRRLVVLLPLVLVLLSCPGPDNVLGVWLETNRNYGSRPTEEIQSYMEKARMLKICTVMEITL